MTRFLRRQTDRRRVMFLGQRRGLDDEELAWMEGEEESTGIGVKEGH